MTQETYYDMCEQLGIDPEDGDIPVTFDDLSIQTQHAFNIFQYLPDNWDSMNGVYLGKSFDNIEFIFELLEIDRSNWLSVINLLNTIITLRMKKINNKRRK